MNTRIELTTEALLCVSNQYDPDGKTPYDNLEDFLAMCCELYGEAPELRWYDAGEYTSAGYYEGGALILVPA